MKVFYSKDVVYKIELHLKKIKGIEYKKYASKGEPYLFKTSDLDTNKYRIVKGIADEDIFSEVNIKDIPIDFTLKEDIPIDFTLKGSSFFYNISKQDFIDNYQVVNDCVYSILKPHIKIFYIDGTRKEIPFETNEAASHYATKLSKLYYLDTIYYSDTENYEEEY